MKKILGAIFHPVVLVTLGLLAIAALIWYVGPLISIAGFVPLGPAWLRLTLIALLLLFVLGRVAWRAWRKRRAERSLTEGIAAAAAPAPGEAEVKVLGERFAQALAVLREAHQGPWWRRRQGALYELPWYIFVGAPGSGKTTALLNAGLTFPLAAKLGQAAIKGVGGTRNCDWWFTGEAVLIDTAGKYATQQSDAAADAAAWDGFLGLLKQSRPRRPINGVLLTVNTQDLLQQPAAERQQQAAQLRARLQELNDKLGIRAPVYVLVTKADLIGGFNETFQDLGREDRDQVFGYTLPEDAKGDLLASFGAEFDALAARLRAQLIDRLQAERDVIARAAIFAFPQQFEAIGPALGEFLGQIFGGGGAIDEGARLRGVYFTSGTQEGTPIDRVLGTLVRAFGVERRTSAMMGGTAKSYFLHRLLREVVFAEQGLVGVNRKAERRRAVWRSAAFAALAVVSIALLVGWSISAWRNRAYVDTVAGRVPALRQAVDAVPEVVTGDLSGVAGVMKAVQDAARPTGFMLADPPLLDTLGLYQGRMLDAGAQVAYRHLLEHALLPRIAKRNEELLRTADRNNIEFAYEALKAYLMLHQPEHFDADALKGWISLDWDNNAGRNLSPEQRAQLDAHLDALLAMGAPRGVPPMDQALVGAVRDMLAVYPTEARVYSRLQRLRVADQYPEFTVANAAGPQAAAVFERVSGQPLTKGIPGLYTRDGYHKGFQAAVDKATLQMAAEESWVLGVQSDRSRIRDAVGPSAPLADAVRRLYFDDYIRRWDDYLKDVRMVRLTGDMNRNVAIAGLLAGPDSPLSRYVRAVVRETTLVQADPVASVTQKINERTQSMKNGLKELLGTPAAAPLPVAQPEQRVDDHFAALRRLTEGQPPQLDEIQKKFNDVYVMLSAVAAAANSKAPAPPPDAAKAAKDAAGLQPEPIRSMLAGLADASLAQGMRAQRSDLTAELRPIAELCRKSIADRYPFAGGATGDVLPEDFGQMFGSGGALDDFFQRRLAQIVDTGTTPWSYKPGIDGVRPATPAALADFQRAARIREVFFRGGGKLPGFKLDIRATEIADGLKEVVLDIDGQVTKFVPGNTAPVTITWPSTRVASQIKLSTTPAGTVMTFDGPWALFRLFDRYDVQQGDQPEKFSVILNLDGKRVRLEVTANSVLNPFRLREMQQFRCPGAL